MPADLFDRRLRAMRRDRAARGEADPILLDRAFDECLDRLKDIPRSFHRTLLIGCPSPMWPARMGSIAGTVDVFDPGKIFAERANGVHIQEDRHDFGECRYDLCLAIGTLDSVNDLPLALRTIARALKPDAPLIGAIAGGNSLPALRSALIEAGRFEGRVVARTHPRIDPPTLARLLAAAGFGMPVIDVDRVRLRYRDLDTLVRDLRAMAATSVLAPPAHPMSKNELQLARRMFEEQGDGGRTEEVVEILHFLAWAQQSRKAAN